MNAMKKWVVAGLIGLSSAAVSMAAPLILDSFDGANNTSYDWDKFGGQANVNQGGVNDMAIAFDNDYNPYAGYRSVNATAAFNFDTTTMTVDEGFGGGAILDYVLAVPTSLASFSGFELDWVGRTGNADFSVTLSTDGAAFIAHINGQQATIGFGSAIWDDWYNQGNPEFALTSLMLSTVMEITFVWTGGTSGYTQLNNIQLNEQGVPEPETVWMMLAVLASLGVTFRRQLMDLTGRFVKT